MVKLYSAVLFGIADPSRRIFMKRSCKIISLFLSLIMLFGVVSFTLSSCEKVCETHNDADGDGLCDECGVKCSEKDPDENPETPTDNDRVGYTISVKSIGGMAMSGLTIFIYKDSTLSDLVDYCTTDENGYASVSLARSTNYTFKISGAPKGYDLAD